jgi:hypothetical protein
MDDHLPGSRKPVTRFQRLPERQIEGSIQILDPPCALYEDHTLHNDTPASTDDLLSRMIMSLQTCTAETLITQRTPKTKLLYERYATASHWSQLYTKTSLQKRTAETPRAQRFPSIARSVRCAAVVT